MSPILVLVVLPLIGFLINGIAYPRLSNSISALIGLIGPVIGFGIALYLFQNPGEFNQEVELLPWIQLNDLSIPLSLVVDPLSAMMLLIITGVGSLIHIYSIGYMSHDEGFGKFFAFLNLFIFFMLMLVLGSNFVVLFIGWEGVGLCSYLLIGFWNKRNSFGDAARKAFIMNRIGDLGFLIGIFLIYHSFGTLNFQELIAQIDSGTVDLGLVPTIAFCLFIGAMGKSAQIPLFTWLPDAMAGPTPVSALIHAATMVTAGIYMVIRANVLFELSPEVLNFIGWVGLATALLGAIIGLFQNDIKKVLAYSTVSQLGYMFIGLGASAYTASFFHVTTHAFFKALLFLGAGSVIHALSDEQDIRKMGGLAKKLPITFITFLIATIAISGIPPFSGFFSKDEILANLYHHDSVMWWLAILGSALTSFYMFRVLIITFFGEFRGTKEQANHLHESPLLMSVPLMILAILSMVGGLINMPHFFGGNEFLANWLEPIIPSPEGSLEFHLISLEALAPILAGILPAILAIYLFGIKKQVPVEDKEIHSLTRIIYDKFYIDEVYEILFQKPIIFLSKFFSQVIDFLVIDLIVEGTGRLSEKISIEFKKIQNGSVGYYIFYMTISIGLIILLSMKSQIF